MLGNTYDSEVCSAARALEVVGERWSLLIVRNALFARMTRFNDRLRHCGRLHDPAQVQARPGPGMPAGVANRLG